MENLSNCLKPELIWFAVSFVLFMVEFIAPGFIFFFFGAGALIVSVSCLLIELSLNMQLAVFLVASLLMLFGLRRYLRDVFRGRVSGGAVEDEDDAVGHRAVVTVAISAGRPGRISYRGSDWKAEADEDITAGADVEIVGRRNITFAVKRIK